MTMDSRGFTDRELDIMSVLWKQGSGTVAEVREALGDEVGYTTVLKMLQILEEKGAVEHKQEGRAYRYFPLVESVRAGGRALKRIVNKIFHGSAELLLATLVEDRDFSDAEIARMRSILDRAQGRRGRAEGGREHAEGRRSHVSATATQRVRRPSAPPSRASRKSRASSA